MTILTITQLPPTSVTITSAPYAPAGPIVIGTSQSENDVGIGGTYTFAMEQVGLGFVAGLRIRASVEEDPTTWIEGIVTDFDGVNLTMLSDLAHGSGIHSSWMVGIAGQPGVQGQKGDTGEIGPTGPGGGVPADSPVFTGNPQAPTPLTEDNDNSIATSQFVWNVVANFQPFDEDLAAIAALTDEDVFFYRSAPDTWEPVTIGTGLSFVAGELSTTGGLAPINNPTFTGDPKAPTPTAGDADTSIATTAFVDTSFAKKASPTFTGDPKAPTPSPGDNDTSIATTAFVQDAVSGYQPLDADLTALAALSGTNVFYYRSAANTWTAVTIGTNLLFSGGTLSASGGGGGDGAPTDSPVFTGDPQCPTAAPGDGDSSIANTEFVQIELSAYAKLASPSFSGTPLAPTPTGGDNTTKIATTAWVTTAISGKADSSSLTAKADLASPTFTGDPKSVTPTAGDNDTSIATTAFVTTAVATGVSGLAALAGPTFTGDPKAPTAAKADNDTSIATTAHVKLVVADYAPLDTPTFTGAPAAPTPTPTSDNSTRVSTTAFVKAAIAADSAVVDLGRRVLIQSQTVSSAVASVIFTTGIDSTYDEYEIEFFNVHPSTVDGILQLNISQDGGSTWKNDASYQIAGFLVGSTGSPAWIQTFTQVTMYVAWNTQIIGSGGGQSGLICFNRPSVAEFHLFRVDSENHSGTLSFCRYSACCCYSGNTAAFNALKFTMSSAYNISSGTFNLYGIRK